MAMSNMNPIALLSLKILFIGLSAPQFIAGDDNQRFVYSGFANASLTLDGTASVTPSGLLELTNGTAMSMGHAFYPAPLRLRDSPNRTVQSFSTSFVFGIISIYDVSSHGLTMLVAPSKDFSKATPVQYLGLVNGSNNGNTTNHIFAIELDTWQNPEFGDINNNHVGVDINGLSSVQSYPAGFFHDQNGTFENLTLSSQEAMQVWVDYDREKTQINVTMAPLNMSTKPNRPTVSTRYNLSAVLKDVEAYIGFSSSTGKINTRHYVLGWSFSMNGPAPAINLTMLPKLPWHQPKGRRSWVLEIVLPVATAVVLLSLGAIAFILVRRHFRYAEVRDDWEVEFGPHRFSYKDLFHATGGFEDKNLLGVGGFGRVYKGVLPGSRLKIAVKRVSHDSKQGMKEFIAEIVSIGCLQNRNLVRLFGYCRRKGELLLVYEYMPNGSLDKYLHEEWEKVVVHRDIKASNVLLDEDMNGRLGDFGLARLYDHGIDPQTTQVVGTIGYLAPELARSGNATPPTDVFSFGMFVLEVTCGQRPLLCRLLSLSLQVISMPAMKHIFFLQLFLLLFGLIVAPLASGDDQFLFSSFNQTSLTIDGCAMVTDGGLLDLSNGTSGLKGHAFYPTPLHFRKWPGGKVQSFSVNVVFSIFIMYADLSADGMAFFIAPTKNFSDARAPKYFGLLNEKNNGDTSNHIFMIELDTW